MSTKLQWMGECQFMGLVLMINGFHKLLKSLPLINKLGEGHVRELQIAKIYYLLKKFALFIALFIKFTIHSS